MIFSHNFDLARSLAKIDPRRFQITHLLAEHHDISDRQDLLAGLSQSPKSIPSRYFYDDRGSLLFEQICDLPEYYPTRTEAAILQQYSREIAQLTGNCELAELGSGSSRKTRFLLDAYQSIGGEFRYLPSDVSASILEQSAQRLILDYPHLSIQAWVGTYDQFLASLKPISQRLILFLGSTYGNFDPPSGDRFFSQVAGALATGGYFLLGVDLQKSIPIIEAAYNDDQGITAAFNLNLLTHLNRRFQGDFDETAFTHLACYNAIDHQIEMYLVSRRSQTVSLRSLDVTLHFAEGEKLLTEISRKFDLLKLKNNLDRHGLTPIRHWTDTNQHFGLILCQRRKH
jgi:L-histidine N-alpha-methyltransferase